MPTVASLGCTQLEMAELEEVGLLVQHLQYCGHSRVFYNNDVSAVVWQHTHQWQVENILNDGTTKPRDWGPWPALLLIGGSVKIWRSLKILKPYMILRATKGIQSHWYSVRRWYDITLFWQITFNCELAFSCICLCHCWVCWTPPTHNRRCQRRNSWLGCWWLWTEFLVLF